MSPILDDYFTREVARDIAKYEPVPELSYRLLRTAFAMPVSLPSDWNPNYHLEHDGEWEAFMPHEVVEFEGHVVPLFPRPGET